jgi:hypothetical protein
MRCMSLCLCGSKRDLPRGSDNAAKKKALRFEEPFLCRLDIGAQ